MHHALHQAEKHVSVELLTLKLRIHTTKSNGVVIVTMAGCGCFPHPSRWETVWPSSTFPMCFFDPSTFYA
jgi:hypothetical protein